MVGVEAFAVRRQQLRSLALERMSPSKTTVHQYNCAFYAPTTSCRRWMTSSSSSSADDEKNKPFLRNADLVAKHSTTSDQIAADSSFLDKDEATKDLSAFLQHQQEMFDNMAPVFAEKQTIPPELIPIYETLASKIVASLKMERDQLTMGDGKEEMDGASFGLLDVAAGTGALWPFLLEEATRRNMKLRIQGVDLSPQMVQHAQEHAQYLLEQYKEHEIEVVVGDIMDYPGILVDAKTTEDTNDEPSTPLKFDGIVCNACWGNFLSQARVLQHLTTLLQSANKNVNATAPFGKLFITHPLGANFVQQLHESDPRTVPHLLPLQWSFPQLMDVPLEVEEFLQELDPSSMAQARRTMDDSVPFPQESVPFYYCALRRVRHKLLSHVWRFRGPVASGFGRGGKKLGFPTANLAASQFLQDALHDLETGVYVGWAQVEGQSQQPSTVHPAVVNVGYSPTFEGQTNPEKIIEAHLMPQEPLSDFYGEPMRLELLAYLRPEQKFGSFPELIAQIQADADDAKDLLDRHPVLMHAQTDAFFGVTLASEGDSTENSSWERQDMKDYLESI